MEWRLGEGLWTTIRKYGPLNGETKRGGVAHKIYISSLLKYVF